MSIRIRLISWYAAVVAVSLAGFALIIWFGTRAVIGNDIDTRLELHADGLERFLKEETHGIGQAAVMEETREYSTGLPEGMGVQLFDRDGRLLLSRPEAGPGILSSRPSAVVFENRALRALSGRVVVAGEEFQFTLWRSVVETEAALGDLGLVLLVMVPAVLLASIAGGWMLSRRALQPIDDITNAARRISLHDLSKSLPVPPHRDELQRLCEAWNEMLGRLDESTKQLRQFTADASHELRTPVALIRTTAELTLRNERSSAEYRDALANIQHEAEELSLLIQNLMDLARADSGHSQLALSRLDLREVVADIRPGAESIASESNLALNIDMPSAELPIAGDRAALRRLLLLLLENAMKFTAAPGNVSVRAKGASGSIVLEVEDTGAGIAPEDIPRIFDRFYQADSSRFSRGVGLGLSIANWIVQSHHGRIEVQSEIGKGSVFRVWFPALL